MNETAIQQKTAQRRVQEFERKFGRSTLHLAYHAALPAVLNTELLHLLRINFLFDSPEPLPYTAEADLLLSSICQEIGDGLYEIDSTVRDVLLQDLVTKYGYERIRQVAGLLWQYIERRDPWGDQVNLERAQQLTVLNFLDSRKAKEWFEKAEIYSGHSGVRKQEWFVAIRKEIKRGEKFVVTPEKPEMDSDVDFLIQHQELLNQVKTTLSQNRFVVLYGQPMVGKTRLLIRLAEILSDAYISLMVTCQGFFALDNLGAFVSDLVDQLTVTFNSWAKRNKTSWRLDTPHRNDFYNGEAVKGFYVWWQRLRQLVGKKEVLVVFDEFERLMDYQNQLDPQILLFLDNFVSNSENGYFILVGSERIRYSSTQAFSMLIAKGKPIYVGYYSEETVNTIFLQLQRYLTQDTLQLCAVLCGGHPWLVRLVAETVLSSASHSLSDSKIEKSDFASLLNQIIDRAGDVLWMLWNRLSSDEQLVVWLCSQKLVNSTNLENALVCSINELIELANRYNINPVTNDYLRNGVANLEYREWIKWENKDTEIFRLKLGLVALWVRRNLNFPREFDIRQELDSQTNIGVTPNKVEILNGELVENILREFCDHLEISEMTEEGLDDIAAMMDYLVSYLEEQLKAAGIKDWEIHGQRESYPMETIVSFGKEIYPIFAEFSWWSTHNEVIRSYLARQEVPEAFVLLFSNDKNVNTLYSYQKPVHVFPIIFESDSEPKREYIAIVDEEPLLQKNQPKSFNIQDSVVLITSKNPAINHFSTGFVIHRTEQGAYVLTCAHVVDAIGGREQIKVDDLAATVTAVGTADSLDLAVLYVKELLDKPALGLRDSGKKDKFFVTAGFHLYGQTFLIESIRGKLNKQVSLVTEKLTERIKAWSFELIDDHYLQPGYSGAPVVDETNGNVIGIITDREAGDNKKGLAISLEVLNMIWPEMPSSLLRDWQIPKEEPSLPKPEPLMNFENELDIFEKIATGQDIETRLIVIYGASGMGKSRLLQEYERIANENSLSVLTFNLQSQISIEDSLNQIVYHLGLNHFPHYYNALTNIQSNPLTPAKEKEWWRNLTRGFFEELGYYSREARVVILFDSYEKADPTFKDWLIDVFLPGVFAHQQFILVIAGQEEINPKPFGPGQHYFHLKGLSVDWFHRYAEECNVQLDPHLLVEMHELLRGQPQRFVEYVRAMQLADEDRYNQQQIGE